MPVVVNTLAETLHQKKHDRWIQFLEEKKKMLQSKELKKDDLVK
jgi:hypothetical protein